MGGYQFDPDKALAFGVWIASVVISYIFGLASTNFLQRPKLTISGSGGGGSQHEFNVNLENRPGRIGINLNETIIFGKRVHGLIKIGPSFDRRTSYECFGTIMDNDTGDIISQLTWRVADGTLKRKVTLESGQSANLLIFAATDDDPGKYFIYEWHGNANEPFVVPPANKRFNYSKNFTVIVRDKYDSIVYQDKVTAKITHGGMLTFASKKGGSTSFQT